jgi:hypothetical protein
MSMRSIKAIVVVMLVVVAVKLQAQTTFQKVKSVKGIKVHVQALNATQMVVIRDDQPNQRYVATDLPEELRKDGLHLSLDGDIGAIPPNVRMIGTPFRMTCIRVSAAEQKKYKLAKRKYCLKK